MDSDERGYPRRVCSRHQKIVNEQWPLRDAKGEPHARGIPDQPSPTPVRARAEWEGDGEEWINGTARRWTRQAVFVTFGRMSSRLSAVRDSGNAFGFITTLTMHNAHELEFVFELAAEYNAALVQVHPLEPDGAGADLQSSVPDSTELGFAFFEATRLSVVHDIPVQIDLVTQKDLRSAPSVS